MTDTIKVRIGLQSARELELVVEDGEAVAKELESGSGLVWITDSKGNRHGIFTDKLAFVEIEGDEDGPGIGFSTNSEGE